MYNKFYLISCLFIFFSWNSSINAQIYIDDKAIYKDAEEYLEGEEYEEALPLYLMLEKKGLLNSNISYKIGICYLNIQGQKSHSISYFENAVENVSRNYANSFDDSYAPIIAWLRLGQAYLLSYKFDKAKESFFKFQQESDDSNLVALADYYISQSEIAELLTSEPTQADIQLIESNSYFQVYNLARTGQNDFVLMEKRKFYDAIVNARIAGDSISKFVNLTPAVGSDGNVIVQGGSENGKTLIFAAYNAEFGYDLYYSELMENGKWSKYKKFPEPINSVYNETSAYLTENNELYFTSNRKGGLGGLDIYLTKMNEDGVWSKPVNLGNTINTTLNEFAPILSNDGLRLFFSSEGHLNMGGYDLFYADKNNNAWSGPVNLGSPVSTPDDDIYLWWSNHELIYYTTGFQYDKNETGSLYRIVFTKNLPKRKVIVNGTLSYPDTLEAKETEVIVHEITDNKDVKITKTTKTGEYAMMLASGNYDIVFSYNEQLQASQKLKISDNPVMDIYTLAPPEWFFKPKNVVQSEINADTIREYEIYLQDVLFGFNSTKIDSKYFNMLDSVAGLLQSNNTIQVHLTGYTDNIGDEAYNMNLSAQRAKVIVDYIQSKGALTKQVNYAGKGENNPVALNNTSNGLDNPVGRRFNRRVTFKFTGTDKDVKVIYFRIIPDHLKMK